MYSQEYQILLKEVEHAESLVWLANEKMNRHLRSNGWDSFMHRSSKTKEWHNSLEQYHCIWSINDRWNLKADADQPDERLMKAFKTLNEAGSIEFCLDEKNRTKYTSFKMELNKKELFGTDKQLCKEILRVLPTGVLFHSALAWVDYDVSSDLKYFLVVNVIKK